MNEACLLWLEKVSADRCGALKKKNEKKKEKVSAFFSLDFSENGVLNHLMMIGL